MERDFETVMIEQCAPVLAGLKPAGLFRYETRDRADLARRVAGWNAQLNPKGLQVRVLRGCIATRQYLVYVYRAAKLQTVLADAAVRGFLAREGYRLPEDAADCNALLDQLSLRLCCAAEAAEDSPPVGSGCSHAAPSPIRSTSYATPMRATRARSWTVPFWRATPMPFSKLWQSPATPSVRMKAGSTSVPNTRSP